MKQQPVYLGDYKSLTRTNYGARIYVDTRSVDIASHILLDGDWEPNITRYVQTHLAAGINFVDVGANFGWYTLLAAMRECHVIAFEANPLVAALLRDSVAVNGFGGRTTVHETAVLDRPGTISFGADIKYPGGGHVNATQCTDTWEVKTVALDDVVPADTPVHFLKIDAEGCEPEVLRGATRVLSTPDIRVLFEHCHGKEEPFKILEEQGFGFSHIDGEGSPQPVSRGQALELPSVTMILAKR